MHLEVLFVARCQGFIFEWVGRDAAIAQIVLNRCLVRRFITVEEVADLVAFLFGPSAKRSLAVIGSWTEALPRSERYRYR